MARCTMALNIICAGEERTSAFHASRSPQSQQPPERVRWKKTSWPSWSDCEKHSWHSTHVSSVWHVRQTQAMSPVLKM